MKSWRLKMGYTIGALAMVAARAADSAPADLAAGKKIYVNKCARCHKFYDPSRYDDAAWSSWMTKMKKKARLDDEQYRLLTIYVDTLRAQ
jgi:cytochrome c5